MIKANDLRIGNWVTDYYGSNGTLVSIHKGGSYRVEVDETITAWGEENIKGIPLTPEILEKCGFEKSSDPYGGYLSQQLENGKLRIAQDDNGFYHDAGFSKPRINHLHQLQNLYFALTGTELTIKL